MFRSILNSRITLNGSQSMIKTICSSKMSTEACSQYKTLKLTVEKPFVYHVQLQRPDKYNAMNQTMWIEIGKCFQELAYNGDCRVIILSGIGKHFTTDVEVCISLLMRSFISLTPGAPAFYGLDCVAKSSGAKCIPLHLQKRIDLMDMSKLAAELADQDDVARRCKILNKMIHLYQDSITSLEKCNKPVIGAIHGACIGGGVDLICATDIRYCTEDAWFQVKEVDIGMAADVGTLQRLPRIVGSASFVNELAFTCRKLQASEAKESGLVSKVFNNVESLLQGAIELGVVIAEKSPVAVQGTKRNLIYSRDHTVQEGLDHIADWNQTMLQSDDFMNATVAQATKSPPPTFSKL